MKVLRLICVVMLVSSSGCAGILTTPPDENETEKGPMTETPRSPTEVSTPTKTSTPSQTPIPANPWGKDPVIVSFANEANSSKDLERITKESLEYWERNDENHTQFSTNFKFEPNATDPDIEIQFVKSVSVCGSQVDISAFSGCAPYLTEPDSADSTTIKVETSFSPRSVKVTTIHELGHTLGLNHDSEPVRYMSDGSSWSPATDAVNRSNPWYGEKTIRVGIEEGSISYDNESAIKETREAVAFYNSEDQYLPSGVNLEYVNDPANADIVYSGDPSPSFTVMASSGSKGFYYGLNYDSDDPIEEYTYAYIQVNLVQDLEYHVGYWLGKSIGLKENELPPKYSS